MSARMHIDGCHFFAWVYENAAGGYEVIWYERNGDDLTLHADDGECERCTALLNGAKGRERSEIIDLSDDTKEAFFTVLAKIGEFDEEKAPQ